MEFKELSKEKTSTVEQRISKKWKEMDILERTIANREGKEDFVFYDGPIYANAKPGIHHVFAKTIKDAFCKYKTMQGYRVLRKIGLDTHGLPIEVNVEKKLGFKSKADIENLGIEKFCEECKKETDSNIDEVRRVTDMQGQFIDVDNPYITCSNDYIESEWWVLNEMNKKGLLYYGSKVLPYCPRCGTELASHEVSQGYKEVSVNTVIVPFKRVDSDEYFLVWTTTPWTLIANVALCVNPDITYIKAESMGYKFIVAKDLADRVLGEEYRVLDTYKGKDLVGIKYEQLMPFAKVDGKAFEVLADNYVTCTDGTGIVHIAPAYGADDGRVCSENGIGFVNPVGKDGKYLLGPWEGRLVTDSELEIDIIKWLKSNDKLFKKIKMVHDYPHCWRCKNPLIYYAKPAWYIKTTAYKDRIIAANKEVNWHPSYVGTKRFNNWLENMVDWGISRNRFWGCPLPVWMCDCGHFESVGSIKELRDKAIEDIDDSLELHRPYVDNIHIKCPECGRVMNRVSDVMDVWFDSGVMPYAQMHYPFENRELFESQFPADFIAEGIDQTRGWFYVLLVISTIISGKSSFKNVVVNDMMLDAYGKKMSKSVGNIIDPIKTMEEYGADPLRWYMLYASPVWTPLKFDIEGLKEVHSKFFNPLRNCYNFFAIYATADGISDMGTCTISYENREDTDKWVLSKYNRLVKMVIDAYNEYDLNRVVRLVTEFVSDDLSNWYIRRNRDRFWASEMNDSKRSVYMTVYEVLTGICKLIAPIASFTAEEIYTCLTNEESVHLTDFPTYNESYINDALEEKMDLVRDLISLGRNVRERESIKIRQPLSEVIIDKKYESVIGDIDSLIKEELNVKVICYDDNISHYMNVSYKPNFKVVGKVMGSNIKEFAKFLENISEEDVKRLHNGELVITLGSEEYCITPDMVEERISSKEGYDTEVYNNLFIVLNTNLTDELIREGNAREVVSKVQQLRKSKDFDITDRIILYIDCDDKLYESISANEEFIMAETLSTRIERGSNKGTDVSINEFTARIEVEKI